MDPIRLFVPLRRTELRGTATGPLADLTLTQIFSFSRKTIDRPIEALYRFPLPGDAAVTGVNVLFGDVEIVAELKERSEAEEYEKAKEEGRQAALTTRKISRRLYLASDRDRAGPGGSVERDTYCSRVRKEPAGRSEYR